LVLPGTFEFHPRWPRPVGRLVIVHRSSSATRHYFLGAESEDSSFGGRFFSEITQTIMAQTMVIKMIGGVMKSKNPMPMAQIITLASQGRNTTKKDGDLQSPGRASEWPRTGIKIAAMMLMTIWHCGGFPGTPAKILSMLCIALRF
jgi:hypothetical protein